MPTIQNQGARAVRGMAAPDGASRTFDGQAQATGRRGQAARPTFAGGLATTAIPRFISRPFNSVGRFITGVTKDSAGVALGFCNVQLFRTVDDLYLGETTSDGSGNYTLPATAGPYYIVAYKVGSPDVGGTTVNTLVGA